MLFTPFSRTWWKSLVKGEGSSEAEAALEAEEAELEVHAVPEVVEEPPHRPNRNQKKHHHHHDEESDVDADEDGDHFTHEGSAGGDHSNDLMNDDPMAPAFDLDRGVPISPHSHHHNIPAQEPHVNVKSAKEFFNSEILYRFDILEDSQRGELEGSYRIELKGYQGGIWTVLIGQQLEVVNRREDAEIVINMHQKDFLQLVNGELNPQLAIFAQKMRVQGDLRRCITFDRLLTPYID